MKKKIGLWFFSFFIFLGLVACQNKKSADSLPTFKEDVFDNSFLHEVRLSFEDKNFWDSLVWYKKLKDSLEVNHYQKCNLLIDGYELKNIGVRFKGESSYDFTKGKKKSFKLDLNCFEKKQKFNNAALLNLNNNYKDPSFMREKITLDILKSEGLPTPASAFAKVYLNNTYWGVYLLVEGIDKAFLKRNFNNAKGNLYFGEPNGTLEKQSNFENYYRSYRKKNNKKTNDWSDLISFINVVNASGDEKTQEILLDSIFNVDNCLKTWAISNLFVNVDAYNMLYPHNYFLYHDSASHKLNWINYDYNYSFAAWNPTYTYEEICNFPILYGNEKFPLAKKMLTQNSLLKKRYVDVMKNMVEKHLDENTITASIQKHYALIKQAVKEDELKEYATEDFEKNLNLTLGDKNDPGAFIPGLKEFVKHRKASVLKQLSEQKVIN